MDVDGISFKRSSDAGAYDVDDAGLWDDRVVEAEGARRRVIPQKGASLSMARPEQKGSVHRALGDLVDNSWLEPSNPRTQTERTFRK